MRGKKPSLTESQQTLHTWKPQDRHAFIQHHNQRTHQLPGQGRIHEINGVSAF